MKSRATRFKPEDFTPYRRRYDDGTGSAEDKAWFANHFVRFVEGGCSESLFTERFYRRLSGTFGHIAHYSRGGFWHEFFTTEDGKLRFLEQTASPWIQAGDPEYTFRDVEVALGAWVLDGGALEAQRRRAAESVEARERAQLAKLLDKYIPPIRRPEHPSSGARDPEALRGSQGRSGGRP